MCYNIFVDTQEIIIDNKRFRFVKKSRRGDVAVYTSGELFARVGKRENVERILKLHKKFDGFGFPVPEIVGSGEISAGAYYLEKSLGERFFSFLFEDDIKKYGEVSPELFEKFISISEKFARAQLRTAIPASDNASFTALIGPQDLAKELPEYGEKILKLYDEAVSELAVLPAVLTHGDFCSHNLFPAGIIDFEKEYYAPAGYDIVTNIFQNKYFPTSRDYEYFQYYSLTEKHFNLYYQRLDAVYREAGLPELSAYRRHFEYCRALWHTARNQRAPKVQRWRYELFKRQYMMKLL